MTNHNNSILLLGIVRELRSKKLSALEKRNICDRASRIVPGTDLLNLVESDLDDETIVELSLAKSTASKPLDRESLVALVGKFLSGIPFPKESDAILAAEAFDANCKHPAKTDLIFFPEEYFPDCTNPTAEMIVELALNPPHNSDTA